MAAGMEHEYMPWSPSSQENRVKEIGEQYPSVQMGAGSLVCEGLKAAEGLISIKRSIIGKHVKLGSNVKIADSIIMDNVSINNEYVTTMPSCHCLYDLFTHSLLC
jgi:NDP-sugar pyrophosphorylase family protein